MVKDLSARQQHLRSQIKPSSSFTVRVVSPSLQSTDLTRKAEGSSECVPIKVTTLLALNIIIIMTMKQYAGLLGTKPTRDGEGL